jgi:hypothetical protein
MTEKTIPNDKLAEFFGVGHWYKRPSTRKVYLSPAVKSIAENSGGYWLINEIAFAQNLTFVSNENFQYWHLSIHKDRSASLTCSDDDEITIGEVSIEYADFSRDEFSLIYFEGEIMLPDEYWQFD